MLSRGIIVPVILIHELDQALHYIHCRPHG